MYQCKDKVGDLVIHNYSPLALLNKFFLSTHDIRAMSKYVDDVSLVVRVHDIGAMLLVVS